MPAHLPFTRSPGTSASAGTAARQIGAGPCECDEAAGSGTLCQLRLRSATAPLSVATSPAKLRTVKDESIASISRGPAVSR